MKERLKYYLRGLGTGIIVTMVLMLVSNANAAQDSVSNSGIENQQEEDSLVQAEEFETEKPETKEPETKESVAIIERSSEEQTGMESQTDTWEEIQTEESEASTETVDMEESNVVEAETSDIIIEESASQVEESPVEQESESEAESIAEGVEDAGQQTVDTAVTIQVVKGDGSGTVARKLQNAGLIDNASEFDAYLMQHGYDKKIRIGTVKIEAGATWMEIADKLTGK